MKKLSFIFYLSFITYLFQSCKNDSSTKDSVDKAKDSNAQKDTVLRINENDSVQVNKLLVTKDAADFAVNEANICMTQIALSKLANRYAASQRVKDLAAMILQDYKDAMEKLKELASAKHITLPSKVSDDSQKDIDTLKTKRGIVFDKQYLDMMIEDNKKATVDFKEAGNQFKDPDIQDFTSLILPKLLLHLDYAKAIGDKK